MPVDFLESIEKLKQAVKAAEEEDKEANDLSDEALDNEEIENPEEQFEPQNSMDDLPYIKNVIRKRFLSSGG